MAPYEMSPDRAFTTPVEAGERIGTFLRVCRRLSACPWHPSSIRK